MDVVYSPRGTESGDTRITEEGDERLTNIAIWQGDVLLAGAGTLSASPKLAALGFAMLAGSGDLAADGKQSKSGMFSGAGVGGLSAFGEGGLYGLVSFKTDAGWVEAIPFVNTNSGIRLSEDGTDRILENGAFRSVEKFGSGGWLEPDRAWVFVSGTWRRFI